MSRTPTRPPPVAPPEAAAREAAGGGRRWLVPLAAAWLVGFVAWFSSFTLHGSGDARITRLDLWQNLPVLLLEMVDPVPTPERPPGSVANLSQRVDLLLVAGVILAGAWGLGGLLLRLVALAAAAGGRTSDEARFLHPHPLGGFAERTVFTFGLGLAGLSLITLGCGLAGWLTRPVLGGLIALALVAECGVRFAERRSARKRRSEDDAAEGSRPWLAAVCLAAAAPFLGAMLLGAMTPPTDFDVKAYHLQAPKEFYEAGRIGYLPHNVYASFPFLTEMLSLLGMVLRDDWYRGALAGKVVLMAFAPLTALAVYAAGRRWFGPTAGCLAALFHLTTPWTYRISIIAYAEGGLTFYLFAALLATALALARWREGNLPRRYLLLAGLLAGSAMACKYTGLVISVLPLGAAIVGAPFLRRAGFEAPLAALGRGALVYGLGVVLAVGPWLAKNAVETGNPVYPLLYTVFGGRDWDAELNAKWRAGHSPDHHQFADLGAKFVDVVARSDWQSPLLFALAPLALLLLRRFGGAPSPRLIAWLWAYVAFLFLAWWILTHRIDRFWIPMIPVVALLAGAGAAWSGRRGWRWTAGGIVGAVVLFNLAFIGTILCGNNAWLGDLDRARREAVSPQGIRYLNGAGLPAGARVLAVGEAQVFDARFPIVYNTVFNRSIFEEWFAAGSGTPPGERPLRPPHEIRRRLREAGITHVYVNWQEVLRYRTTYGHTDFVHPQRFERLQEWNILERPLDVPGTELSPEGRAAIEDWAPQLLTDDRKRLIAFQVFRVLP